MGTQRGSEAISRRQLLSTAAIGVAALAVGANLFPGVVQQLASAAGTTEDGELASLAGATQWLWTYTCINWLRTLPYVRAWAEKYRDQGLVVIGAHTPEFPFEHDIDNVRRAVEVMRLPYPIAVDSDYAIWRGFNNHYWPALYFVDAQGRPRHHQFGEGEYEQAERFIQQLLAEAGATGVGHDLVSVEGRGFEAPGDWADLKSEENYVGYDRTEGFASPGGATLGQPRVYAAPARLGLNRWALAGDWTVEKGASVLNKPDGRIVYAFHARDLHVVMGPTVKGRAVRFRVRIDGQPPGAAHGLDVDDQGMGTVIEQRLYQLIRQPMPIAERQFEIEFLDPGVAAYGFTFG
jgi:hypothetical protein